MAFEPPEDRVAVADASFLIGLCLINQTGLLAALFDRVLVAAAVWEEVVTRGGGRPGAEQIAGAAFVERHTVQQRDLVEILELFLDPGEAETLALARERSCSLVLMDDFRARQAARRAGMRTLGVVGLLLEARRRGLIDRLSPHLVTLRAAGFRLSDRLVAEALREAGEE